jgi:hypothetical protein
MRFSRDFPVADLPPGRGFSQACGGLKSCGRDLVIPTWKRRRLGRWRAAKLQHLPFFAVDWRVLPMTARNFRDILMAS